MKSILLAFTLCWSTISYAQSVDVVNYEQLEQRWTKSKDTTYLINFWATWCVPCVKELPDFTRLDKELKDKPFKMILVSLDFASSAKKRVPQFLAKKGITTEVVILKDNPNVWINKVDANWDGAIPATLVIKGDKKAFYAKELEYETLKEIVHSFK